MLAESTLFRRRLEDVTNGTEFLDATTAASGDATIRNESCLCNQTMNDANISDIYGDWNQTNFEVTSNASNSDGNYTNNIFANATMNHTSPNNMTNDGCFCTNITNITGVDGNATRLTIRDVAKDVVANTSGDAEVEEWNPDGLTDGQILTQNMQLYGSLFVVCLAIFCIVRRLYPRAYNLRSGWISDETVHPLARKHQDHGMGRIAWLWRVWLVSDSELADDCGMDALCLVRILEWGCRLSALGSLLGCVILMPVYATAGGDFTDLPGYGVERLNTSNVPDGTSGRLLATVVVAYAVFGTVMATLLKEFDWFYSLRYRFLSLPLPRNYVVYVRNLPEERCTSQALVEYFGNFEAFSPPSRDDEENFGLLSSSGNDTTSYSDANARAWVALKFPDLKKLVAKRAGVLSQLEHQINIQEVCHQFPKVRDEDSGLMITVVDHLWKELEGLNAECKAAIERIEARASLANPRDFRSEDYKNPYTVAKGNSSTVSGSNGRRKRDTVFFDTQPIDGDEPAEISRDSLESSLGDATPLRDPETTSATKSTTIDASGAITGAATKLARDVGTNLGKAAGITATAVGSAVQTVGTKVAEAVPWMSSGDDGVPMRAGFVAFSSLRACQAARQMIHSRTVFGMEVLEAPGHDDIFWGNVGKSHKQLQLGLLLSTVLTGTLCLFWTVIVAFIATLSSVEGLTGIMPFINRWLEEAPWLEPFLAQLSPLMIVVANSLLKVILENLSGLEGPVSGAEVEASLFGKLSAFMILQNFFVQAVSGSLVAQLTAIYENPTGEIVSLLANSLPKRSTFFIQLLLVDTCVGLSMELLRVTPVGLALARSFVGPKLTEEERRTTWMGLRPFADPYEFQHAEVLAGLVLYFTVFFVYVTLAPITSVFVFLCFFFMGAAYRHQFIFIYPPSRDSGGKLWIQFMRIVPITLIIAEITIVGFLALKGANVAWALMIPLFIITILFNIYIQQKHFKATEFLPGCDCIDADRKNNFDGAMDMRFISDHYLQPELRDKEVYPSNASLTLQLKFGMIENPEDG